MNAYVSNDLDVCIDSVLMNNYHANDRDYNVFHPSTIGGCIRKPVLDALYISKKQPSTRQLRVFDNGHDVHRRISRYFREAGVLVKDELVIDYPQLNVRGHSDDLILVDGNYYLVEVKTANNNSFNYYKRMNKPADSYYLQLQLYMHLANKIYDYNISAGYILIENKNTQDILVFRTEYDATLGDELEEKIKTINKYIQAGYIPPVEYDNTKFPCSWKGGCCDYYEYCWKD